MVLVKALLQWNDEAKYCEIREGTYTSTIIETFHSVFKDRSGSILQEKTPHSNIWTNVGENFRLTPSITNLRLLPSKEKLLGLGNLNPSTSIVFCCDLQERFRPAIKQFDAIVAVGARVVKAAKLLNIPIVVTEQYPRGLGKTVSDLGIDEQSFKVEKTKFSMLTSEVQEHLDNHPLIKSVILFGVEAHVCVQQTVLDLIGQGFDVHVIADATSSRSLSDRQLAFERLQRVGAFVTSCETVLLQWVADKNHEQFKPVQSLIKELPPDVFMLKSSF